MEIKNQLGSQKLKIKVKRAMMWLWVGVVRVDSEKCHMDWLQQGRK